MEYFIIFCLVIFIIIYLSKGSGNKSTLSMFAESLQRIIDELYLLSKDISSIKKNMGTPDKYQTGDPNALASIAAELKELRGEIRTLREELKGKTVNTIVDHSVAETTIQETIINQISETPVPEEIIQSTHVTVNLPTPEFPVPFTYEQETEIPEPSIPDSTIIEEPIAEPMASFAAPTPKQESPVYEPYEGWFEKWIRNNPDLEKFIGENLINKIGIAVLVLGIAFFVKYAIDQNWINETGRVMIGMGCGGLLVGLAHYLRSNYRSFSSVLAGGGIAVFYFTIAFAYHQYHIIPQTAAFIIMVVITAFAIALSVLYDRLELAVIATIGGFITPFLVSNGEGNYIALFSYLIILNVGLLSLAWFKRWPVINIIALFFTEIIYAGWLGTTINNHKPVSYPVALAFATAFYLLFLGMNMIYQLKNKDKFKALDFLLLLLISFSYYGAGMALLHQWNNGAYQGLFTLLIGIIDLSLAYTVYKKGNADRNLLYLLIGLTLTFITLTIPIQLRGHAITMFWSAEFVLLYWLSVMSGIKLFRVSSILICILSLLSLLMDWQQVTMAAHYSLTVIYKDITGLVTNIVAIGSFGLYYYLLSKREEEFIEGISNNAVGKIAFSAATLLLFITLIFGVNLFFRQMPTYDVPNVYHRMITELMAIGLLMLVPHSKYKLSPWVDLIAFIACFIFYIFSTDLIANLRLGVLNGKVAWLHFVFHWVDILGLVYLFLNAIKAIRKESETFTGSEKALGVVLSGMAITLVSLELMHIYVILAYSNNNTEYLINQYSKAGLTVIWALSSFTLMWLGMKHKQKILRIISLTLFSIVLLKLFAVDISGISEGGKILAFIFLGVILLTVSFMYQKLKKIIIDDKEQ